MAWLLRPLPSTFLCTCAVSRIYCARLSHIFKLQRALQAMSCSICLETLFGDHDHGNLPLAGPPCGHVFHKYCIGAMHARHFTCSGDGGDIYSVRARCAHSFSAPVQATTHFAVSDFILNHAQVCFKVEARISFLKKSLFRNFFKTGSRFSFFLI